LIECAIIDKAEFFGFASEKDVLCDRQFRHGTEFLMNHRYPKFLRDGRGRDRYLPVIDENAAAVAAIQTDENLHHRGFSGAVFAHQSVNAAGFESQIDAAKHADPIKLATKIEVAT